jgi:hypothetical protein
VNVARLTIVACAFAAACAEAGGESTGGGLTDAGKQAVAVPVFDAGAVVDCNAGGSKWSELYRDIFGAPEGTAGSCRYAKSCHGSPDGDGAKAGSGIQCYDEAGCRQSMIDHHLATPSNKDRPDDANLFGILRHPTASGNPGGIMPRDPASYVYPDACRSRIRGWIANGVPAD